MLTSFLLLLLLRGAKSALLEQPPEQEDLLIVKGLEYDFSRAESARQCAMPVGLEKNELFDGSFSASSYRTMDRSPEKARLNSNTGWQPKTSDINQWLAIDLKQIYQITGIGIQSGAWVGDASGSFGNWITRYRVQYSDSNYPDDFVDYTLDGVVQHFDGNQSPFNIVKQEFRIPIVTRYVRVVPEAWEKDIALRVELYGCFFSSDLLRFTGMEVLRMDTRNEDLPLDTNAVALNPFRGYISLRFKTDRPSGLIVHGIGSTGDYLTVELVQGVINVHVNLGTSPTIDGHTTVTAGLSLYDNQWHWLNVSREGRSLVLSLDGYETYATTSGSFQNLNNSRYTFGGTDQFTLPGITVQLMFKGCMENIDVSGNLVISGVKANQRGYSHKGYLLTTCIDPEQVPVTFEDYRSMIYVSGSSWSRKQSFLDEISNNRKSLKPFLVIEFSFRTWEEGGLILYNSYPGGYLQIGLFQGMLQVLIYIANDPTPYRPANIGYRNLNDGAWHITRLEFSQNFIVAIVDEETFAVNRLFNVFQPSSDYHFGGYYEKGTAQYKPEMLGFIGCLRALSVNGASLSLQRVLAGNLILPGGGRVKLVGQPLLDQCPIVDRCTPNPCFHGGLCFQSWFDFVCDCSLTNYDNDRLCYSSSFLPSCEAYEFLNQTSSGNRYIDVDGAGPMKPFLVNCHIGNSNKGTNVVANAINYLHGLSFFASAEEKSSTYSVVTAVTVDQLNKQARPIPATPKPGAYSWPVGYGGVDFAELGYFADMSGYCMQWIYAKCWSGAKLLNSPAHNPAYAWWVSRQGYKMLNWGNATAHSGKCGCGMANSPLQQCKDTQYYCNCDGAVARGNFALDTGFLTEKEYLPMREVRAGGTDGQREENKRLEFIASDLMCAGDERLNNMASFWSKRSAMRFPAVDATYALDISFYFKTRSESGVLMMFTGRDPRRKYNYPRNRDRDGNNFYLPNGYTDYFTVSLVNIKEVSSDSIIEVKYHNGFLKHVYRFYKPNERRALNDGVWHFVHVTYTIKDVQVRIDNLFWAPTEPGEELYGVFQDADLIMDPRLKQTEADERLFLGDQVTVGADAEQQNGFVGCMRAVLINGNLLDLRGHAAHEPGYLTKPGCVGQCDRNPCQNNGICFEYWDQFVCDCQESAFKGEICTEEVGYYYDGSDMTEWTIPDSLRQKTMSSDTVTFGFVTDKPQGTIFQLIDSAGSSIQAYISGKGLRVKFDYGGFFIELEDPNDYIDKQFHSVVIKRDTRITMQVDNYPTVVKKNIGSVSSLYRPSHFFIGNGNGGGVGTGFIGCISRVRVNYLVPLKATAGLESRGGGYFGNCGQLAAQIDPFWPEDYYPNWQNDSYMLPEGSIRDRRLYDVDVNIAVGVSIVSVAVFIIVALVAFKYFTRKGSYRTQEDAGAFHTRDANTAIKYSSGRLPGVTTREEIFI